MCRSPGRKFLFNGELLLSCRDPPRPQGGRDFVLVRRDMAGRERVQWRSDAWIASMAPIDEKRVIVSTVSWQFRLGLFETAGSPSTATN